MNELISKTEVIDDLKKDIEESNNWLAIAIYLAITVRIMSYKNIDVVEVVHGEWKDCEIVQERLDEPIIDEWQSARCSVCGKYHTTPYMYYFDHFNYCPNCGAKMNERMTE